MCGRVTVSTAMLLFILHAAIAQTVSQAYAGDDGNAHVVYAGGVTKVVPPEPRQVGCESVSVAPDQRTSGWSVLFDNCCTSYPIPIAIVVYRDGRKTVISPGQMIYEWHFVGRGDRISVLFGPVHGYGSAASVYDARSGRVAASWDGKGVVPKWAKGWEEQVEHLARTPNHCR